MRVTILSYDYSPAIGGMGELVRHVTAELRRGHPEDVWTVVSPSTHADYRPGLLGRLRWKKLLGCPLFSVALLFEMRKIIRDTQPDIVHVHAGSGGVFLLSKPKVPLLVTAHHTYAQEVRYVFAEHPIKHWTKWLMSFFEKRTYAVADHITAVSLDTKKALMSDYGISEEKITVLENPVIFEDIPQIERRAQSISVIGRLEARKGVHILLRGFAEALKQMPQLRLRLVGRNLLGNTLKSKLRSLGIQDHVDILGFVNDRALREELASATCVVVPSVVEGFGLIAAQAMKAGAPVIVSQVPGLRSLVHDHETGLFFDIQDPLSLKEAIVELMQHEELRETLGRNAKRVAMERFDLTARSEDLYTRYTALAS